MGVHVHSRGRHLAVPSLKRRRIDAARGSRLAAAIIFLLVATDLVQAALADQPEGCAYRALLSRRTSRIGRIAKGHPCAA